jgi:hypothetical protein
MPVLAMTAILAEHFDFWKYGYVGFNTLFFFACTSVFPDFLLARFDKFKY